MDVSGSLASLWNGSRGVKKIVCLPLLSFPPATSPASVIEYWSLATHVIDEWFPLVQN